VPADEGYLQHIQAPLEKPADGLVAQILKPQVLQAGSFTNRFHAIFAVFSVIGKTAKA
jgi:hypothetical protein